MIDFSSARVSKLASTWCGNSGRYENFNVPRMACVPVNEVAEELLLGTFAKTFEKASEMLTFRDTDENNVYRTVRSTFSDPEELLPASAAYLTEDLYKACTDPKVQGGEFFAIYFEDLMVNGEPCSALGLWKIEGHVPYFKTEKTPDMNLVTTVEGFAASKPQVMALIINIDENEGYQVCTVDTVTKRGQRSFWKDEFLKLVPIEDDYFQTRHNMALTAEFINERAATKLGLGRVEVMGLSVKARDYFLDNEEYFVEDLAKTLFPEEDRMLAFLQYREDYATAYSVPLNDYFNINPATVKKDVKAFNVSLKLDKNFTLAVKGRIDLIERGYDEVTGKSFYKVFFETEE
jgi:37-kD nucleoid-associated bacterial protein